MSSANSENGTNYRGIIPTIRLWTVLGYSIVIMIIAAGAWYLRWTVKQSDTAMRSILTDKARLLLHTITVDSLTPLTGLESNSETLLNGQIEKECDNIRQSDKRYRTVFFLGSRSGEDRIFHLTTNKPLESDTFSPPGKPYQKTSTIMRRVFRNGGAVVDGPKKGPAGTWVSVLVPVAPYTKNGQMAVFGIDMDAHTWIRELLIREAPPFGFFLLIVISTITFLQFLSNKDSHPGSLLRRLFPPLSIMILFVLSGSGVLLRMYRHTMQDTISMATKADALFSLNQRLRFGNTYKQGMVDTDTTVSSRNGATPILSGDHQAVTAAITTYIVGRENELRRILGEAGITSGIALTLFLALTAYLLFNTDTAIRIQHTQLLQSHSIVENIQLALHIYHLDNPHDDGSLRLIYANQATEPITGRKVDDIIGKLWVENFSGSGKQDLVHRYADIIHTQTTRTFDEIVYDDNKSFIAAYSVKAFPLPGNNVGIAFENITERKKTETALLETNRKLESATMRAARMADQAQEASIAKSQFLANMSHEIRTPLNGIITMAHLLLESGLNDQQYRSADILVRSGKSLLDIINDILDFSKIEAGKIELSTFDFNLKNDILDEIVAMLGPQAAEKKLTLTYTIDPHVPLLLRGDSFRLRQILINLAGNALKFTEKGEVTIRTLPEHLKENKVTLRFLVRDTGIGIPGDKLPLLFNKFSQVDPSTTRSFGGTGLGLSISKQLVELMGGEIGVISQENSGSEFWFTVSLEKQTLIEEKNPQQSSPELLEDILPSVTHGKHILIAEDNPINQKVATIILGKLGYTVTVASNGKEAIQVLSTTPCDLVLMDCQMPVMDGYEAAGKIRSLSSQINTIPIIALTAHATTTDRNKCLASGMNDYLAKPFSPVSLGEIVEKWLNTDLLPQRDHTTPLGSTEHEAVSGIDPVIWDRAGMLDRVMNDEDIVETITTEFIAAVPRLQTTLEKVTAGCDCHDIEQQAHSIKGAASIVGAEALRSRAAEMELAARSGNLDAARSQLGAVRTEFQRIVVEMERNRSKV